MKIEIIKCLQDNYSYLIIDETHNTACVIDPSEAKPIIKFLENNKIVLINTHDQRLINERFNIFKIQEKNISQTN